MATATAQEQGVILRDLAATMRVSLTGMVRFTHEICALPDPQPTTAVPAIMAASIKATYRRIKVRDIQEIPERPNCDFSNYEEKVSK